MSMISLLLGNTYKYAMENIKNNSLYKMIIKSIPELLVSVYFMSVILTFFSHQEGLKGLASFLQQIGFGGLADGLSGIAQFIDGYRGLGLFLIIFFVFTSAFNSYILWFRYESRRIKGDLCIKVPGSAYFVVFAAGALWDYFKGSWRSIPGFVWVICVVILILSVVVNFCTVGSDLISRKEFKKKWEDMGRDESYFEFCCSIFIFPIVLSAFAFPLILLFALVGAIEYPSEEGVIFREGRALSLEERMKAMDRRKAIREDFKASVAYNKKYQEIMEFVDKRSGGDYVVLPILPDETAAGIQARIQKVAKGNPGILVFSDGKKIVDVQVVNIPIEPQSQGDS